MSNSLLKGALVGGLIVFIWGMFSWMVLPWHQNCLSKFQNESSVAAAIRENAPVSGMYVLPNTFSYNQETSQDEIASGLKMMESGPFVFASVRTDGIGSMNFGHFILSFLINFAGALIVTWMLLQAKGLKFKKQVGFVTLFGLGIGILSQIPDWNWWGFSGCYVLSNMFDYAFGWFLGGLGIAKVLKK